MVFATQNNIRIPRANNLPGSSTTFCLMPIDWLDLYSKLLQQIKYNLILDWQL